MKRLAFATCRAHPEVTADDALAAAALRARGVSVVGVPWDQADADWSAFDAVVVRSTWDYYLRLDEFRAWLDRVEAAGVRLLNPPAVLRANVTKHYLRELGARGVPVVPTVWVEDPAGVEAALQSVNWPELVVKPVVSAGAFGTERLGLAEARAAAKHLSNVAKRGRGLMIQPFVSAITVDGEYSFLFFGGRFSHAVRKQPAPADFRVQEKHGGQTGAFVPEPWMIEGARQALVAAGTGPLPYARVDMVRGEGQSLLLVELELTEPVLFLAHHPEAASKLAEALTSES